MLKNKKFLIFISLYSGSLFSVDPTAPEADPVIHIHIENKQEANNTVNLNKPPKKTRCSLLLGDKLKECVHTLKKKKQKKILKKFSKHHRTAYLKTLSKEEYTNFLDSFTENEWQEFFAQLSAMEKKQWPKTIKEQKAKLEEIKKTADEELDGKTPMAALLAVGLSIMLTPALAAPISAVHLYSLAQASLESEETKTKEYINEKFG